MNRDELHAAVSALPGGVVPGYIIDSDETDEHVSHSYAFCFEHASMIARIDALLVGASMHVYHPSMATDRVEYCEFNGCGVELDTGSLTDDGVDSALALTESEPLEAHCTKYELQASAMVMGHNDPRWATWEAQARQTIRRSR